MRASLTGVHLTDVHLTDVHLIGVHFTGVHFTGVYLIGMCNLWACGFDLSRSAYHCLGWHAVVCYGAEWFRNPQPSTQFWVRYPYLRTIIPDYYYSSTMSQSETG